MLKTTLRCAREIAANLLMGIPPIARYRVAKGRTSLKANTADLQRFALGIVDDNPVVQALVKGADVCEIGPGDHLATGLVLLASGAASYTVVDRFPGPYSSSEAMEWYKLVRSERPGAPEGFPNLPNVHTVAAAIEDIDALPSSRFDLVISQAVGEHVSDIDIFAKATRKMLKTDGVAVHNIDFSNHGLFPEDSEKFLSIPEPIWYLMGSNRGLPNRKRKSDFIRAFSPYFQVEIARESSTWASFVLRNQSS
jgi:hypothetical protein